MTASTTGKWIRSSKRNPCPICQRVKDSSCGVRDDGSLVSCHYGNTHHPPIDLRSGDVVQGIDGMAWAYTGDDKDGRTAMFTLHKPRDTAPSNVVPIRRRDGSPLPLEPAPLPPALSIARLPSAAPLTGSPYAYSATQRVQRIDKPGGKTFRCEHLAGGTWRLLKGPDPWPAWCETEAATHGRGSWVLELEGERCVGIARSGGAVAITQPGHAHKVAQIEPRYRRLLAAGVAGIVFVGDHDTQGDKRASQSEQAAAAARLPFLHLPAVVIWPDLPPGGSIDDAHGDPVKLVADIEAAAANALRAPKAPAIPTPSAEGGEEPPADKIIDGLMLELLDLQLLSEDTWGREQAIRAQLWHRGVSRSDIDERLFYALAARWGIPLQSTHGTKNRNQSLADPDGSPSEDLIPGFLQWCRDALLFGPAGTGKTMVAGALAAACIKGESFLDFAIQPQRKGKVLWIGTDGGEAAKPVLRHFLEELNLAEDPEIVDNLTIWTADPENGIAPWSCTPAGLQELRTELEVGGYSLVIIDSLKATLELAGVNFGIGPVGTLLRLMQGMVGRHCSLLWLHHPDGKAAGRGIKAAGGSQNINQIPNVVHEISRKASDRGPVNVWTVHKLRGSRSREFSYRLTETGFEVTEGEVTANARTALLNCLHIRISAGLPTSSRHLPEELMQVNESTVRNNLSNLRKEGLAKKAGLAWKLTPKGRRVIEAHLGITAGGGVSP